MRKNKKSQSQETNIKLTEIDYDKSAKSITKAILESKNEEAFIAALFTVLSFVKEKI